MKDRAKADNRAAMELNGFEEHLIGLYEIALDAIAQDLINQEETMRHNHPDLTKILLDSRTSDGDWYDDKNPVDMILDGLRPELQPEEVPTEGEAS